MKRGISAVIATVLIILITLSAVSIVWIVVLPMISDNLELEAICQKAGITIDSSQGFTCYDGEDLLLNIERANEDAEIVRIIFVLENENENVLEHLNEEQIESRLGKGQSATWVVQNVETNPFKISVYPVININGKEKECDAVSYVTNIPDCAISISEFLGNGNDDGNGGENGGENGDENGGYDSGYVTNPGDGGEEDSNGGEEEEIIEETNGGEEDSNGDEDETENNINPQIVKALIFQDMDYYPSGDYTLIMGGSGKVKVGYGSNGVYGIYDSPGEYDVNVNNGTGLWLTILESDASNPINNIQMIMPGHKETYEEQIFYPSFIERTEMYGILRFMDFGYTNGNNVFRWDDRTTPDYYTQARDIVRRGNIIKTEFVEGTPFTGSWAVKVTTKEPHGLVTGQLLTISGTEANLTYNYSGQIKNYSLDRGNKMIEVISNNEFLVFPFDEWRRNHEQGSNNFPQEFVNFTEGNKGEWVLNLQTGAALEYMVEIANVLNTDPWFNIPHLANDDYVKNYAEYVRDNLNENLDIYVEYSNEVWNTALPDFSQTHYVWGKARERGVNLREVYADESDRIWKIWRNVFSGQENRIKRVAAGQAVNPWMLNESLLRLNQTNYDGGFDVISVTSYFGPSGCSKYYTSETTPEEIALDSIRNIYCSLNQSLPSDLVDESKDSCFCNTDRKWDDYVIIRDYWSDILGRDIEYIAYEAGQGISVSGRTDLPYFQAYLDVQNIDLMYEAYKILLKGHKEMGIDGIVFFKSVQMKSPWGHGSWGHLEYQDQLIEDAPKYRALMDAIDGSIYDDADRGEENLPIIGINLNWVNDWSGEIVFVDVFKRARKWITSDADDPYQWSSGVALPSSAFDETTGFPLEIPYTG